MFKSLFQLNSDLLFKTILGKKTLVRGQGTIISRNARVINNGRSNRDIRVGENSIINGELFVFPHGGRIQIGNWCFVGSGTKIWSGKEVRIADRVLISHNVNIMDSLTHPMDAKRRHEHFRAIKTVGHPSSIVDLDEKPIRIEDDVWIGASAQVMRGVTIGRGAVVAAAAVVTKDVESFTLVAGNPARVIRELSRRE